MSNIVVDVYDGVILCLMFLSLVVVAAENGKPRTGKHNFALTFIMAIGNIILFYLGGLFL